MQMQHERYEIKMTKLVAEAEKTRTRDEYHALVGEWISGRGEFEWKIRSAETQFLLRQGRRHLIPVPALSDEGHWEWSEDKRRAYLTLHAMRELRALIRDEQRQRWEPVKLWLPLLTGLVGALIGLVSALQ